jgi:hypothetical protein
MDPAHRRVRALGQLWGTLGGQGESDGGHAGARACVWAAHGVQKGVKGPLRRAGASGMGMEGEDWGLEAQMAGTDSPVSAAPEGQGMGQVVERLPDA